jgi:phosphoglycolate phosphatase-like HAD superfamily hydrolase
MTSAALPRPRVLALDFDGVIWDSAGECFETGWRTYKELFGADLSGHDNRQRFLAGRPAARTGHDFYIILRLLETEPELDLVSLPLDRFQQLRTELAEPALRFDKLFYALRSKFRDQSFQEWASWQGPYPEVIALLDRWESRFQGTALATTKDQLSAHALLQSAGRDWPVFGKEFSVEKDLQIQGISQKFGVPTGEILFVDDLLENLQQVTPTGAHAVMASWGYNTAKSRREAEQLGYPVVSVEGLQRLLEERLDEVRA